MRLCFVILSGFAQQSDTQITVDPSVPYQTILGWEAPPAIETYVPAHLLAPIIEESVKGLGLTRIRLGAPAGNRSTGRSWEWENDNGDPDTLNWNAIETAKVDLQFTQYVLPFRQRVLARGEPFTCYASPSFFDGGSSGSAPIWLVQSPGEYAEFALSYLHYLKNTYNLVPSQFSILNEAGNNNAFTPAVVAEMIRTLAPKLQFLGYPTQIQFPECVDPDTAWNYIQALQSDPEIWPYVGVVSYHLYGGLTSRPQIRDFGIQIGRPTAMSEFMGLKMSHLYDDLILGGVSYWGFFGTADYLTMNASRTGFTLLPEFWRLRQVLHYVRPGASRVKSTSDSTQVKPLSFVKNGKTTVVLWNTGATTDAQVTGLSQGTYGVSQTVGSGMLQELGMHAVSGVLSVTVPGNTVLTIYPHSGGNLPPVITSYGASSTYVTLPTSSSTLSTTAQDPELDSLTYAWTVAQQPSGANAQIADSTSSSTGVSGLSLPGDYRFIVTVKDSSNQTSREVLIRVVSGNQPPVLVDVHNRKPVMVTLWTTTMTLQGFAWDPEGDPLTMQWNVVSQPAGASVSLSTPDTTSCWVSNIKKPGDYVFQFQVQTPQHTVAELHTVPVYPVNSAPTISAAAASPADITLPTASVLLSATTADPEGDEVTHWWSVQSAPAGASPIFASPGQVTTSVFNLGVAGIYTFRLTAIDRTLVTTKDIAVTVHPGNPPPTVTIAASDGQASEEGGDPGAIRLTRTGDLSFPLTVQLQIGGSATNGADYASLGNSTTIPAGQASATIPVSPVEDGIAEESESVWVGLAPDPSYLVGSSSNGTVTILDVPGSGSKFPTPPPQEKGKCGMLGLEALVLWVGLGARRRL